MNQTLLFYDLETTGIHPRRDRIMQFAAQRTTLDLEPIGDPFECLIQLTSDILPDPEAILLTGITPQKTKEEGYSEREFAKLFMEELATPGTIFVGFNTIRFDDEFLRALLYRNLYDPYEWQWMDDRGKWDLLDVTRMTRALRPEGIVWPTLEDGSRPNRLELLTELNGIIHAHAHAALSDVDASIDFARLLKHKQPKLFAYLFELRDKKKIATLLSSGEPLVYTSGSYPQQYEKTTVISVLETLDSTKALVYDLRIKPTQWLEGGVTRTPLKVVKYNHCPALAPLGVLDGESMKRLEIDLGQIEANRIELAAKKSEILSKYHADKSDKSYEIPPPSIETVDSLLYDGFYGSEDKKLCARIRSMTADELVDFQPEFNDHRLPFLFFLYKARQLPKSCLSEERKTYEAYVKKALMGGEDGRLKWFMGRLQELAGESYLDADKRYILEELALYAESIVPASDS